MKVILDPRAVDDLENIHSWISSERPNTANTVVERIFASLERLGRFPDMGRAGAVNGTRELVVPRLPFIVVYAIDAVKEEVRIIGIFHAARSRAR